MPQASYPYAVGRIRSLENGMLDTVKLKRIAAADLDEALKILLDSGYGAGAQGDEEKLIKAQLAETRKLVMAITPDAGLTGLFLLPIDAHNLKVLLKARLLGVEAEDMLEEGGIFPVDILQKCVAEKSYYALPPALKKGLEDLERQMQRHVSPRQISAAVDVAVFAYIAEVIEEQDSDYAREYFSAMADLTNVRTLVRARVLGWDAEMLSPLVIPCGSIAKEHIVAALEAPNEQLVFKLNRGRHGKAIVDALDEYMVKNSAVVLEKRMNAALMKVIRAAKNDIFGLGPVVGYLMGREAEAKALRLIFAAKRAGSEPELPDLYV